MKTNKITHDPRFSLAALASASLIVLGLGCATTAPSDHLVDARDHYDIARNGVAQQHEPDLVHEASVALEKAEAAHDRNPGSERERHLAYIADRKALEAIAEGKAEAAQGEITKADSMRDEILLAQRNAARTDAERNAENLDRTQSELADERQARLIAQRELEAAMASLKEIADIKAEQKDIVITLSGEVLFETAKSTLRPLAKDKLDKVAKVLREQGEDKVFIVEGHTDSRGSDSYNEDLSRDRADAVRSYLVGQGVSHDRIRAEGMGEADPVASNDSPEGRANNRRVEIIVHDEATKTASR